MLSTPVWISVPTRSPSAQVRLAENVLACIYEYGRLVRIVPGKNIVCNEGDLYYAQSACGETPDTDFTAGGLRLGTGTTTPAKADTDVTTFTASTGKAESANYPKTDDSDAGNTGAGTDIITWKFSYSVGDFTGSGIAEGAIVDDTTTPTKALCHFLFGAAFDIGATNSLIVYVNHQVNGT